MHLVMLQVSEDDMTEANEKRSAGVMAMSEGEVVFLCYVYCSIDQLPNLVAAPSYCTKTRLIMQKQKIPYIFI